MYIKKYFVNLNIFLNLSEEYETQLTLIKISEQHLHLTNENHFVLHFLQLSLYQNRQF